MHFSVKNSTSHSSSDSRASLLPSGYLISFALTTIIFFIWGMSNNLTDILVQQFKKSFELSLLQAQLVQTANFLAYGVMAVPAALITERLGYRKGLVTGLVTFGIGTLLFWPAAVIGQYTPFLIALFLVGGGASILETAANPLVAQFGDAATSEQRLNFAQAFNPPGTILGVLLGTWFIFSGIEKAPVEVASMKIQGTYDAYLHKEILRVVPTYVALGVVVLFLAFLVSRARFPRMIDSQESMHPSLRPSTKWSSYVRLFSNRQLMSAVVAQFFYVGAQVGTWSTLIPYLREYTVLGNKASGYFLTGTLVALALGRIVSTPLMRFFDPARMMTLYASVNLLLLIVGISHPGLVGGVAILATSFFMSIMYPTIFALGIKGLGGETKLAGSLLVMAIIGGALAPPLMGWVSRLTGSVAQGYWLPAAGYIVVALYGFLGPQFTNVRVSHDTVTAAPHGL